MQISNDPGAMYGNLVEVTQSEAIAQQLTDIILGRSVTRSRSFARPEQTPAHCAVILDSASVWMAAIPFNMPSYCDHRLKPIHLLVCMPCRNAGEEAVDMELEGQLQGVEGSFAPATTGVWIDPIGIRGRPIHRIVGVREGYVTTPLLAVHSG